MRKKILIGFIFLIILAVLTGAFAYYNISQFGDKRSSESTDTVQITVAEGESFITTIEKLVASGLVSDSNVAKVYVKLFNLNPSIKFGDYSIEKNKTFKEILEILEKGTFKPFAVLTIKEGLRDEEIGSYIFSNLATKYPEEVKFDFLEFDDITENPRAYDFGDEVNEFLDEILPQGKPLTGLLFPDTYNVNSDATALDVITKMLETLKDKITSELSDYKTVTKGELDNFYEGLTLSSIIEKEASGSDDRTLISSVFHNRLNNNWQLQSDATVNFATGKNLPGVLIEDTLIDSPFNTYKYTGLPPTPIDNPGLASILASFAPSESEYFFFRHDSQGVTHYSKTFAEHQQSISQNP